VVKVDKQLFLGTILNQKKWVPESVIRRDEIPRTRRVLNRLEDQSTVRKKDSGWRPQRKKSSHKSSREKNRRRKLRAIKSQQKIQVKEERSLGGVEDGRKSDKGGEV